MNILKTASKSTLALTAAIALAYSPVSKAYIGNSTTGASDTWTFNCQLANYYSYYYSAQGLYNWASALYFYYNGVGYSEFFKGEGNQSLADYHLNNGLSLYYYFVLLDAGDVSSANAYYYFYQAYALYSYHFGLGDTATAESQLNLYLGYAAAS